MVDEQLAETDLIESRAAFLPVGWSLVPISAVCEVNPPKPRITEVSPDTKVTFAPMPAVDADAGAITNPQVRMFADVRKGFTSFRDEDVILAKITPCFENGKAAICRGLINGLGFGSTEFHVLRSKGAVLPEYVFHFVRQEWFRRDGESNMTGSVGQKRVPANWLSTLEIPLAPLVEQRRIIEKVGDVLTHARSARERLETASKILRRFRQSVLAAACSGRLTADWRELNNSLEGVPVAFKRLSNERLAEFNKLSTEANRVGKRAPKKPAYMESAEDDGANIPEIPELPASWSALQIQDVAIAMQYGTSVKADAPPDDGVPMLRMGNVQDGQLDISDLKYMKRGAESQAFLLDRGDIVFNRTNSPELVGKAAVFDVNVPMVFASYLIRLKCDTRLVMSQFVCDWINSLWGKAWARAVRTDGVSQSNINATKLGSMPIPVPPLDEQKVILVRVRGMFDLASRIEARIASGKLRSERLIQSTLSKAFRGELVPTEAELAQQEGRAYQTADALLKIIGSAKAPKRSARG